MKAITTDLNKVLYRYLWAYSKTTRYMVLLMLILNIIMVIHAALSYSNPESFSVSQQFLKWQESSSFIFYWLISLCSPLILYLKVRTILYLRYYIAVVILLHFYPLFMYGLGTMCAVFLGSCLYPLLSEFELGKKIQ